MGRLAHPHVLELEQLVGLPGLQELDVLDWFRELLLLELVELLGHRHLASCLVSCLANSSCAARTEQKWLRILY
eukprot:7185246-Heterocapsa_arctica.AAC.1